MKFKYLKHILLCILLFGTGFTQNLIAKGAYFMSDSITVGKNTSFNLPLRLVCDRVSPVAFQFEIVLPSDVTLNLDINNPESVNAILNQERLNGHLFAVSQRSSNRYRFILFSVGNKALEGENGIIMSLPLKTTANASLGNRDLKFENVLISDEMEQSVTLPSKNGLITINETIIIPREASMTLSTIRSERGKNVNLPVSMTNSVGVTAFQFDLVLPKEVSLNVDIQNSSALSDLFDYQRKNGHILSVSSLGNNKYRFVAFSISNSTFKNSDGTILNIPLKVSEKAFNGTYPLLIETVSIADEQGKDLTKSFTNGSIEVYTGSTPMTGAYMELPHVEAIVNKNFTLPVNMQNFTPATAFQADIVLPDGIITVFPEDVNQMLNPDRCSGHVLSVSKTGTNRYRFLALSMSNSTFKGTSGSILNIPLKVLQSCKPGDYDLQLESVLISDAANKDITLTSRNGTVNVKEKIDIDMSAVKFPNGNVTYDGAAHSLMISGSLPDGITKVTYLGNEVINAGSYEVTVSFEVGELYNKPEDMKATLIISPAPVNAIYFPDKTFTYDGNPHGLYINGELPEEIKVSYKGNEQINAGTYKVTASFSGGKNYITPEDKIATLTISKANIDLAGIKFENKTVVFNGEKHNIVVTGETPTGITSINYSDNDFTDAGTYEITASFIPDNNHNRPEDLKATLIIEQAEAGNIIFEDQEFTYDGQPHSLSITELPSFLTVNYTGNEQTNAGTYTVTANFTADKNHKKPASKSASLIIHKANVDMSGITFTDQTVTFDGQSHTLSIAGDLPQGVNKVNYSQNSFVNVGTYEITATFEVDNNHLKPNDLKATLTINSSHIKDISFPDATFTYDGIPHSLFIKGTLPEGVTVSYKGNEKINAGIYTVTAQFISNGNYEVPADLTANLTINKANIDMSEVSFENNSIVYDGKEHDLKIAGKLPESILSVTYSGNKFIDAGTYLVTASFNVDSNHNQPTDMKATLIIEQAEVGNITFNNAEFVYDGQPHSLTVSQLPEHIRVTYDGNNRINAGTYTVTANFEADKNYKAPAPQKAILTIQKAQIDMSGITFENKTVVFDGEDHELTISGNLPEGIISVNYTDNRFTNIGTYQITTSFEVDGNHIKPADMNATLTIQPSDVKEISFPSGTFTYDGTEHNIYINGILPEGVTVTYEGNGQINAGTYTVTAKFTSTGNFIAPEDMKATMNINKAGIDMSGIRFENKSFVYDGENHSLSITGNLPEGVTEITYSENLFTNAGTYEITASFSVDSNHKKPQDMKAVLFIEQAEAEKIVFQNGEFTFDGKPHSLFVNLLPEYITASYEGNGQTNAGTYTVTVSFQSDLNHKTPAPLKATLTIHKAEVNMNGITFENQNVYFDGKTHSLNINGQLPVGVIGVNYTNNSFINVGIYEVTANFETDENHRKPAEKKATLTIMPAILDQISFPDKVFTYDGELHSLEIIGELPTGVTVSYEGNGQMNAGTYQIVAKFTSDGNYVAPEDIKATLTINKANIEVNKIHLDKTVIYDGKPHSPEVTEGLPAGITKLFYSGVSEYINAGSYEITVSFEVDKNHNDIEAMKATLTILRAEVDSIQFPNRTFTYDGKVHRLEIANELPEEVSVTYENNEQTNAGSYIVTAKFTSSTNYITPQNRTAILTIEKANVDMTGVKFENQDIVYDGTTHALTVVLPDNQFPQGITGITYSENNYTAVGTYEITASFTTGSNYNKPADKKATLTIRPATIEGISFKDTTTVYDGNEHSVFISGELPAGVIVEYEGNKQIEAGVYQVIAKFTTNRNYITPANMYASLTILPASVTILTNPVASSIFEGEALKNSILNGGEASVPGAFEWLDKEQIMYESGEQTCLFIPTAQRNYEDKQVAVLLKVLPAEKYTITVVQPKHGTIRIINSAEDHLYKKGTLLELEITPDEGYVLDSLLANGRSIVSPYLVTGNAELTAKFKQNETGIDSQALSKVCISSKNQHIYIQSDELIDVTVYTTDGICILSSKSVKSVSSPAMENELYVVIVSKGQQYIMKKVIVTQ